MLSYLLHHFVGSLFLMWAWPKLALMFPAWQLPPHLDYLECLTILWAVNTIFPPMSPGIDIALDKYFDKKGN